MLTFKVEALRRLVFYRELLGAWNSNASLRRTLATWAAGEIVLKGQRLRPPLRGHAPRHFPGGVRVDLRHRARHVLIFCRGEEGCLL